MSGRKDEQSLVRWDRQILNSAHKKNAAFFASIHTEQDTLLPYSNGMYHASRVYDK